ncbi:TPA: hypothetical protein ACPWNF_001645 [Pseudomonas aeruginosa]
MTESKICTCPSGDGSLRHPCPAHPAVEQAGGDERAAFEVWASPLGWKLSPDQNNCGIVVAERYGHPGVQRCWEAWQARAALAQPSGEVVVTKNESGAIVSVTRQDKEGRVLSVIAESATLTAQAEQAEAERPEVVARVVHSNPVVLGQCGPLNANDELMTVAQHAASVARWAEMFNRVEQERDAALARVAELENGTVYVEARQCYECHHGGINDSADGLAACHDCDWTGPEPDEDKCPGCHRENCMAAACPECGGRYELVADANIAAPPAQAQHLHDLDKQCRDDVARALGLRPNEERGFAWSYLLASIKSCVKASGDSAQAQHSVPEVSGIGRDFAYPRSVVLYLRTEPTDDDLRAIHDGLRSLAAAPGKEVPQAWLDVQAERRRQVEAEGWTPEHDDLYCAAELPRAAAAYILNGANDEAPAIWPFSAKWWKPRDARSNYVRASALILAEIERLDRAAPGKEGNDD